MNFKIFNCEAIKAYAQTMDEPHVVIQIASPDSKPPKLPDHPKRLAKLPLKFSDVDTRHLEQDGVKEAFADRSLVKFNAVMASQIVSFVRLFREQAETIVVHCEAGISRSPAVAAALDRWLNGRETVDWFKLYLPNRLVYRTLLKEISGI